MSSKEKERDEKKKITRIRKDKKKVMKNIYHETETERKTRERNNTWYKEKERHGNDNA